MRKSLFFITAVMLFSISAFANDDASSNITLEQAIANSARNKSFVARDASRHPLQELGFFGLKPDMVVVEIWPGKGYWTQILAPYLHNHGTYYVALPTDDNGKDLGPLLADKTTYGNVKVTHFGQNTNELAPPGSVDAVLTFRNLHNWLKAGYQDAALRTIYKALKPGGILGLEDHRGLVDVPQDQQTPDGYVQEQFTIDLAKKAGFEFVSSSPINNNPKDTKHWPKGVWTLPPTFALGATDHAKYEAIGEADNFVLLFKKPVSSN
jgi:predicted methyltransferase